MEGLAVNITVATMLELVAKVTERVPLRLADDAKEYAVIGLAVETTGCGALKLAVNGIEYVSCDGIYC